MQYTLLVATLLLFLNACSTKEVYEPKKVDADWEKEQRLEKSIIDTAKDVALLDDRRVLAKDGELNVTIAPTERLIALSDGVVVSASVDGNLTLTALNGSKKEHFVLNKTVAAATVEGGLLAVLFANNEIALYDRKTHEVLFKEQGGKSIVNDSRIVNPYFLDDLVIFATLDGKVIIVNSALKKRLRTIIVSSEEYFNNIIYFNITDNKIVSASSYKLLAMAQRELRQKYEIRNILLQEKRIYLTTKQGEVVALTTDLQVEKSLKFPFAHFLGMIASKGKLYILEKEGYMIVVDQKTFDYTVHEVSIDDGFVFVAKDAFYVDDTKIAVE